MSGTSDIKTLPRRVLDAVSTVIVGRNDIKELLMVALLSGGHVLIEGVPGTGKTSMGKAFAAAIGGDFKRIQLTPDLLPADVTGFYLHTPGSSPKFVPGPIFGNVILADELNRTTPRTQSAFLEAMQEGQVTVDGERHGLPPLFMVIASQQAIGEEGTFPLANVQSDRFMFSVWSGLPDIEEEIEVLNRIDLLEHPAVQPVTTPDEILRVCGVVRQTYVAPEIQSYIVGLARALRDDPDVQIAPGPRASIALYKGGRALAFLAGRDFVLPDDVKQLARPAFVHRVRVKTEAEMDGTMPRTVVERALERTAVPTITR